MAIVEQQLVTSIPLSINIGGTVNVSNAETYNGTIPGPTIKLNVGDTLIVRLINKLPYATGIHWHGIELQNSADGTPLTQNGVLPAPLQVLGNGVPAGGTYLYKFIAPRPGIYWYHPHHHHSTNRVFRGLYGMIVVSDPDEETLVTNGTLPSAINTHQLVLSDITVCKTVNDVTTYVIPDPLNPDSAEWLSGATEQTIGPTPAELCVLAPLDDHGHPGSPFASGQIPNTHTMDPLPSVEGQTVLTNGVNVGGRKGKPLDPRALDPGFTKIDVQPGQGIRLQIVNTSTIRYFRLILTDASGNQINLFRVGGEGGVLNDVVLEGTQVGGFNFKYSAGEILIPTASRADVVAAIPSGVSGVLTLWTRDFERTGQGFSKIPSVPVLHLNVTGAPVVPAYNIGAGTALKSSIPGAPAVALGAATNTLLNPGGFIPSKPGSPLQNIRLTAAGVQGIDGITGNDLHDHDPYTSTPHIATSRYGRANDILQLTITNETQAHHPFHLHGFSFQPISLTPIAAGTVYNWPFVEFRDNINIPAQHVLLLRVKIEDRPLADGLTMGGHFGRWLFHCHIFFHAHHGMLSELVITDPDASGSEKPNINVGGSWAYTPSAGVATRRGKFSHPDGDPTALSASLGTVNNLGGGDWEWELDNGVAGLPDQQTYVYITATDASGRKDQAVFRLKIGGPDDGSDNGDPHIHTIDGKRYDFQGVGEFILLQDNEGIEIQTRQTPVLTANPITDPYTGIQSCVSLNTAVAARVGTHRISWQQGRREGQLQFFIDGKRAQLSTESIDLDGNLVTGFDVNGTLGLRVDYLNDAVLIVTPHFWTSHNLWYLNISISRTQANEGLMGIILKDTWLPLLPSGASVGPFPNDQNKRYKTLYKTFADAWRVTDKSSLFVYEQGQSTSTFTDKEWPAGQPPCNLKPQFNIPGAPILEGMPVDKAKDVCQLITDNGLNKDCVFDVATTGDEIFAKGYQITQEIKQKSTAVQIVATVKGQVSATVSPLTGKEPIPKGKVTFYVDNIAASQPITLDEKGRAQWKITHPEKDRCKIKAIYIPADPSVNFQSTSANLEYCKPGDDYHHDHGHTNDHNNDHGKNKGCLTVILMFFLAIPLISLLFKKNKNGNKK
ncbi:MAG: multicopper oxidase domain-containing protein [Flavitalea sp.]